MREMKKYCLESRSRGISYMKYANGWRTGLGHILHRNCLLHRVTEGKIQGGQKWQEDKDGLKERRRYSHLKNEAVDRTMWRARFGRGSGPVVRQTTKWNEWYNWSSIKTLFYFVLIASVFSVFLSLSLFVSLSQVVLRSCDYLTSYV
jgi:hypothetical protein